MDSARRPSRTRSSGAVASGTIEFEPNGTAMLVDHTRCFEPRHTDVREAVGQGYIGELSRIFATYGGRRRDA